MVWIWTCVASIVLLASLIVSQLRHPRDLFHADPNLALGSRVTRWVGNGIVFFAAIQLMSWLWFGIRYSLWDKDGMTAVAIGLTGFAIVFGTSARRGAESAK